MLGLDVRERAPEVRALIGLAGQYAAVDENLTGRENLRLVGQLTHLPRSAIDARADELLERFDLDPRGRPTGARRTRAACAAASTSLPRSSTGRRCCSSTSRPPGSTRQGRNDLWEVIEDLVADGTTVLLTTQYLEEADRLADHIVGHRPRLGDRPGHGRRAQGRIGATVIEVAMSATTPRPRRRRGLAPVGAVEADGKRVHLSVTGEDGARRCSRWCGCSTTARIEPATLTLREPTLDDVFLDAHRPRREVTGRGDDAMGRRWTHDRPTGSRATEAP